MNFSQWNCACASTLTAANGLPVELLEFSFDDEVEDEDEDENEGAREPGGSEER